MKALKITDKKINISTFEKMVKQRAKEFKTNDTDVLALQFIQDVSHIKNVPQDVATDFFAKFGKDGELNKSQAARNFVYFVMFGNKLYN